ncbi:MAG: hypothetical protein KGO05_02415 [Chloroflexota bacterium]|nr:hypothetical protein [Chloroflexota bacterium]
MSERFAAFVLTSHALNAALVPQEAGSWGDIPARNRRGCAALRIAHVSVLAIGHELRRLLGGLGLAAWRG